MTLRIPAKVLLHVWSYDFYDMTLSTGKQRRHMIKYNTIRQPSDIKRCNEKVQNLKMLFCQHCFLHSRRENVVSFFFSKIAEDIHSLSRNKLRVCYLLRKQL